MWVRVGVLWCCGSFWCAVHYLGVLFRCTCNLCSIIICVFMYSIVSCIPVYYSYLLIKKKNKKKIEVNLNETLYNTIHITNNTHN